MPPKKAASAAAPAKDAKDKKPAAAPAHASYKGEFSRLPCGRIHAEACLSLSPIVADHLC